MLVRFWGTRGSLPVAHRAEAIQAKIARALVAASGRSFVDANEAARFAAANLPFAINGSYGGASACVEIEGGDGGFIVCDMGSGLRDFGVSAMKRCAGGHPRRYNIFLSHMHWDHIMGFPFFAPAFDPGAEIVIHGGHADVERALRRQQEEISFPVAFDWLAAKISFRTLEPGETYDIGGCRVSLIKQYHSYDSYGYRFDCGGKSVVYSTDSEHKPDNMAAEAAFEEFFRDADLVIFDTMYSLADSVTMKADWGHSSNIVAVDMCQAARVKRLAMFHHEPAHSDDDIARTHAETVRYAELNDEGGQPLEVLCSYDGFEIAV